MYLKRNILVKNPVHAVNSDRFQQVQRLWTLPLPAYSLCCLWVILNWHLNRSGWTGRARVWRRHVGTGLQSLSHAPMTAWSSSSNETEHEKPTSEKHTLFHLVTLMSLTLICHYVIHSYSMLYTEPHTEVITKISKTRPNTESWIQEAFHCEFFRKGTSAPSKLAL